MVAVAEIVGEGFELGMLLAPSSERTSRGRAARPDFGIAQRVDPDAAQELLVVLPAIAPNLVQLIRAVKATADICR